MGAARRGYVLIAVLWALALVGAVAAAYAYATRTNVAQARAESERLQAYYAARGACIQAVKDLSAGVRRAELTFGAERAARDPNIRVDQQSGGVQIGDLPAFPPEMAAAGGLLGAIAEKLNQVQGSAPPPNRPTNGDNDPSAGGSGGGGRSGGRGARDRAAEGESEDGGAPLLVLGQGTMRFANADVEVWLEAESGKLNINLSPRGALERLLVATGEDASAARAMLDDIERYRLSLLADDDPLRDAAPRRNPDEPLAGRDLRSIEQLINVPSIDPATLERLMTMLTVYGSGGLDPNYASPEALRAVGIVDERPLRFVLSMQEARERVTAEDLRAAMGTSAFSRVQRSLTFGAPPVFTARTRAVVGDSAARYLIRVTPGAGEGAGATVTRLLESREDWL